MKSGRFGLTETYEDDEKIVITHNGNMGNTIEGTIDPNIARLSYPPIKKLKRFLPVFKEEGSPDYSYKITFTKSQND
jgi:hypothetical protein